MPRLLPPEALIQCNFTVTRDATVAVNPGWTRYRQLTYSPAVRADRLLFMSGQGALDPLLSNDTLTGRETLTSLERRLSGSATYAGVNGDFFNLRSGLPSGGLIQRGQLVSLPNNARSTAGITDTGTLGADHSQPTTVVGRNPA